MANVLTGNPFILDTAADNLILGNIKITKLIWDLSGSAAVIGDTCILENASEVVIWERTVGEIGTVTNDMVPIYESDFNPPFVSVGISLGALGDGKLYIYYVSNTLSDGTQAVPV